MSSYTPHLQVMYSGKTFHRKVQYIRYNLSTLLRRAKGKGFSVLEIGPGLGELIYVLNALKVTKIDIVDNDKGIVDTLRRKFKIREALLAGNISKLNNKLSSYDLIVMIQVLEHIPVVQHRKVIKTLFMSLKRGGSIAIVVPNANNPLGIVERYADIQHYTSFTSQSLIDLVNSTSLKNYVVALKDWNIPPTSVINVTRILLQKILHTVLLGALIVNGGVYFKIMTPNILLSIKRLK